MKEHARPSSWDQEDDFLAFPVSGLSLPGDTQGRDCCQSPLTDLIMPKIPSPGIKLISQMWGSDNWQLRTFCVGPQVSLTACNCRTHVDFSGKQPAFLFAQFDSCTLVKEHPKFWLVAFSFRPPASKKAWSPWALGWPALLICSVIPRAGLYSPVCFTRRLGERKTGQDPALPLSCPLHTLWEGLTLTHLCVNHFF